MYLSRLKLNPRSRRAITEASRPYELHRSLLKAFPDQAKGGPGRVLFRLDTDHESGDMSVLVQSEKEPFWSRINDGASYMTECKCKEFQPKLTLDQVLRFRLRANPTKRLSKSTGKDEGKRVGIYDEEAQVKWLKEKLEGDENRPQVAGGFKLQRWQISREEKIENTNAINRVDRSHDLKLFSVQFDGILQVVDSIKAANTISNGIGSAKGFGFGLLSIAPIKE
jgi:CRISPR system Cascade subunit CasE